MSWRSTRARAFSHTRASAQRTLRRNGYLTGRDPDDVYLSACLRLATCNASSGVNSTAFAHTVPLLRLS